ncbi:MAG: hypothetical protein GF334_01065 [Candidatus Altiarchaeales archaeon]|nr:hypothetical protein [Candidatus Altiarchaeales archaeon]
MADKKKTFMGQPLRARRDYNTAGTSEDIEYDRYGSPKDETGKVVSPAEVKVNPDDDYDSVGRGTDQQLECPFCAVLRRFNPAMLKKNTILVCSNCKGEVPTKSIQKTASGYKAK